MFTLDNIPSSGKKRKRIGRGGARGGTSGRGHKGQKARSGGVSRVSPEGGQMPLHRRMPKRGFSNVRFMTEYDIINLASLELLFEAGAHVTREGLIEKGLIKKSSTRPIKVLGKGTVSKKFLIDADAASKGALQAIQERGGEVKLSTER